MLPHLPWTFLFLSLGGQCSKRLVDVCTSPRVFLGLTASASLLFKAVGLGGGGRERNLGAVCVWACMLWWHFHSRIIHITDVMQTTAKHRVLEGWGVAASGGASACSSTALMLSEVLWQGLQVRCQVFCFRSLLIYMNACCLTRVKVRQDRQICHPQVGFYTGTGGLHAENL